MYTYMTGEWMVWDTKTWQSLIIGFSHAQMGFKADYNHKLNNQMNMYGNQYKSM